MTFEGVSVLVQKRSVAGVEVVVEVAAVVKGRRNLLFGGDLCFGGVRRDRDLTLFLVRWRWYFVVGEIEVDGQLK